MFSIIKSSNRLPLSKLSLPKCILKSIPRYICTIQPTDESERSKSIGRVMSYYLKSIQDKKKVIEDELHEFEIGRYHLARIMGIDIDSMDQKQIDDAIRYLFPSGLYTESARPMMKPPNDIFYKIAEAQFDDSGRPFNSHFYTTKQHLYSALHELGNCLEQADLNLRDCSNNYNTDEMNDFRSQLNQTRCLNKEELMDRFGERISDIEYHKYAATLDRLVNHTNALAFKDVIFKFRIEKALQMSRPEIPPPRMDENGRMYQKATGFRRLSKAEVTVWASGSGKFKIIHPSFVSEDILYFTRIKHRESVLSPLIVSGMLGLVDVEIKFSGTIGFTNEAFAARYGIAWGIASLVDEETVEKLRLAGLLTKEIKLPERKMYGKEGARRRYTWRKR